MRVYLRSFAALVSLLASACAPARAPIEPGIIPQPRSVSVDEEQYGHQVLEQLQQQYALDYNDPRLARITAVVDRLTAAARAGAEPWHVYLFKAPDVKNAAATRGNHVFVWSGMLDSVTSDDELAVILAHELSHVLAGHTDPDPNEEIRRMLIGVGAVAAGIAVATATRNPYISTDLGNLTSSLTQHVGEGFIINPYSKQLEIEADTIGLMLLAEAGYDLEAAVSFWSKAAHNPDFQFGVQFFSTHPSTDERLANIRQNMPLAVNRARGGGGKGDSFDFRTDGGGTARPADPPSASVDSNPEREALPGKLAERWRIVRDGATLFRDPDGGSKRLGEFRRGAEVEVVGTEREWLHIGWPDTGYLRGADAVPLKSHR